jgi:Pyridoxamine 5'-phosphate oxidase
MAGNRGLTQRKVDVQALLRSNGDAWLATASAGGRPHLIAVSTWWDGDLVTIATLTGSRTGRNLAAARTARLAFGIQADAVLVDVEVSATGPAGDGSSGWATDFAEAAGWNPGEEPGEWTLFRLRPLRIHAYRGYGETEGRTVMRDSAWLV